MNNFEISDTIKKVIAITDFTNEVHRDDVLQLIYYEGVIKGLQTANEAIKLPSPE